MSIFFEIELSNPLPAEVTPTQTGDVCPDAASFACTTIAAIKTLHFALRRRFPAEHTGLARSC